MDGKKLIDGQEPSKREESIKGFTFQAKEFGFYTIASVEIISYQPLGWASSTSLQIFLTAPQIIIPALPISDSLMLP